MKKIQYILFALAIVLPFGVSAATFSIIPNVGSIKPGMTITSTVYVNPGAGETISATKVSILFPADKMEVLSYTPVSGGSILAHIGTKTDNTAGTIIDNVAFSPGITVPTKIATIIFRAKKEGTAKITFSPDSKLLDNATANKYVAVASANANFAIVAPAPTPVFVPEPVVVPVSAPAEKQDAVAPIVPAEPEEEVVEDMTDDAQQVATTTPQEEESVSQEQVAAVASSEADSKNLWYYILAIAAILGGILAWRKWGK